MPTWFPRLLKTLLFQHFILAKEETEPEGVGYCVHSSSSFARRALLGKHNSK